MRRIKPELIRKTAVSGWDVRRAPLPDELFRGC